MMKYLQIGALVGLVACGFRCCALVLAPEISDASARVPSTRAGAPVLVGAAAQRHHAATFATLAPGARTHVCALKLAVSLWNEPEYPVWR